MTKVVHCKFAPYDIYIGRPSKWGNPFAFKSGTLAKTVVAQSDVLTRYEEWLHQQPHLMASLHELKWKTLGCWCKTPRNPNAPCHGNILARLADAL